MANGSGEMGIGSGVVHDSDPDAEYEEYLLKGRFFTNNFSELLLIESLLYHNQYPYLDRHLKRLKDSADKLGFPIDVKAIVYALEDKARTIYERSKVRVTINSAGETSITISASRPTVSTQYPFAQK